MGKREWGKGNGEQDSDLIGASGCGIGGFGGEKFIDGRGGERFLCLRQAYANAPTLTH